MKIPLKGPSISRDLRDWNKILKSAMKKPIDLSDLSKVIIDHSPTKKIENEITLLLSKLTSKKWDSIRKNIFVATIRGLLKVDNERTVLFARPILGEYSDSRSIRSLIPEFIKYGDIQLAKKLLSNYEESDFKRKMEEKIEEFEYKNNAHSRLFKPVNEELPEYIQGPIQRKIRLDDNPISFIMDVEKQVEKITAFRIISEKGEDGAVGIFTVEYFDDEYLSIERNLSEKLSWSSDLKVYFRYLTIKSKQEITRFEHIFIPPLDAKYCRFSWKKWRVDGIVINLNGPFQNHPINYQDDEIKTDEIIESEKELDEIYNDAIKKGDLLLAHKISLSNFSNYPHSKSIHRLKHIKSLLQALELDWYPVLNSSNNRKFEPTEGKILHLHKVSYPFESTGGAIRNLNIVKSQKELGLEPIVVTPLNYPRIFGKISFKLDETISKVRHIRLDLGSTNSLNLQYLSQNLQTNTLMLASIIQKEKPELIHAASGYKGYELAVMAKTLSDHFGIPWIYEVRSFHEHTWTKEPEYCMNSERTNMRMKRENSLMQAATHVVTISESMKKAIIERGVEASKITIIPNAVDLSKFKPIKKNSSLIDKYALNGNILLGYISNISYREGHDILIRAMKSIILTNPKVRLMLVGTGAEIERWKLLSKELGLENYIIFTGNVDHSEITQYYSIIDLFIVPRRQDYASDLVTPLKPFEAMAMKIPLLVSDRPALIEIIGDNRGESFITENVEDLSTTVIDCLNNNEKLTANVEEAFSWVTTSRTWESNAIKYKRLYESLLKED